LQSIQGGWWLYTANFIKRDLMFGHAVWGTMRKILHQEKIDLFLVALGLVGPFQVAHDQISQVFFVLQAGALQQLPKLPHLNVRVHGVKPETHAIHNFGLFTIDGVFKVRAAGKAKFEGMVKFGVDRVQPARYAPELGSIRDLQCCSSCHRGIHPHTHG